MIWDSLLLLSLSWVCLRLYQLSRIPRDILEERLGHDTPPVPEISVAGLKSRSVLLCWLNSKDAGFAGATLTLLCNGIKLGEIHRGEDLVEISPLQPNHSYTLRLHCVTSGNVSTASVMTRFQTLPASHHNRESPSKVPASINANPFPPSIETTPQGPRDNLLVSQAATKTLLGRRSNLQSSMQVIELTECTATSESDEEDSQELVQSLTQRLEDLKKQKEDLQRQIEDEETDTRRGQIDLLKERDQLKQDHKEKEDISNDLKRQSNHLEKLNRTAQNKKAAREKLLSHRRAEREKHMDDLKRWAVEATYVRNHVEEIATEKKSLITDHTQRLQYSRQSLEADQLVIRSLEDEIRLKGSHIKELEQRTQKYSQTSMLQMKNVSETSKDEAHQARLQALQLRLHHLWSALNQSKLEEQHAEERLSWLEERQVSPPHELSSTIHADGALAASQAKQTQIGLGPRLGLHVSSPGHHYGIPTHSSAMTHFGTATSGISSNLPAKVYTTPGIDGLTSSVNEELTSGGLSSPAANDLLPSYLLGDEDYIGRPWIRDDAASAAATRHARHAITNSEASIRGPYTPMSANSRNGSAVTSPESSLHNVSVVNAGTESPSNKHFSLEREPNHASEPLLQTGSKFANLFSVPFGRPRGKTSGQEPPALGTLKQGQSQSFPRNIDDDMGDGSGLRRRRGSHGAWGGPMAGLMNRVGAQSQDTPARARTSSDRASRLQVFRSRMNPLQPGDFSDADYARSRPSSTYSHEQPLTRPLSENQPIWGTATESLLSRENPANAKWNALGGPWSKDPSRRTSIQYGSSTNLSLGSTPLISEDFDRPLSKGRAEQAPIGTRPSLQRVPKQKLNPAAPSFKTLFSRSETKKALKVDKSTNSLTDIPNSLESEEDDLDISGVQDETPPPNSRLSRDARSIHTAASTADSYDSLDKSASGTTSDSPAPKETLMQKISRKSSSNKFNVPWSKEKGMFSKRGGESAPFDADRDATDQREEKNGRAWPSMRRKSRKGIDSVDQESEMADDET